MKISWQSSSSDSKMTWGELAAALRGLDDCVVRNQQESLVNIWRIYGTMGEIGWGQVDFGRRNKEG